MRPFELFQKTLLHVAAIPALKKFGVTLYRFSLFLFLTLTPKKKLGITQGRIAQIESRVGSARVTFEVLLNLLRELGYECKIVAKRVA